MELTFVNRYSGDGPKRGRLSKACESCRARKKRCKHYAGFGNASASDERPSSPTNTEASDDCTNGVNDETGVDETIDEDERRRRVPNSSRPSVASHGRHFISDINPESALLQGPVSSSATAERGHDDDIGIWVDRRTWETLVRQRDGAIGASDQSLDHRSSSKPSPSSVRSLVDIYFQQIHPILPLVDEPEFRRDFERGAAPEAFVHVLCLLAAKDSEATPHLRLQGSSSPVSQHRFCTILHASVTRSLNTPSRFDKYTLIRVLALASLHHEGHDGAEEASILLSRAMHYAQTLGIHLAQQASAPAASRSASKQLFWSLYALDRINAASNGRPIIMHDIDIAREKFAEGESGYPAFDAWLRITELLNKIIDFYRPTTGADVTGWEGPYPGLEEILEDVGGVSLPASTLATVHLYYLSVAMLSHRTRGIKTTSRGLASAVRQRLCAIEVLRMLEAATPAGDEAAKLHLHPLPIVPYAVSLSLAVSYQHLRQSQLSHQQADALADFRTACAALQRLRRVWCAAEAMAALARRVLEELDRAPDLASFRVRRAAAPPPPPREENVAADVEPAPEYRPPPTAMGHGGNLAQPAGADVDAIVGYHTGLNGAGAAPLSAPVAAEGHDGANIFDTIDDVFGTFMDPNFMLNLDDLNFVDDLALQYAA